MRPVKWLAGIAILVLLVLLALPFLPTDREVPPGEPERDGHRVPGSSKNDREAASPEPGASPEERPPVASPGEERPLVQAHRIFLALRARDRKRLGELLDAGVPVDVRNGSGRTPLDLAIRFGDFDAADLLIDRGAKIGSPNDGAPDPAAAALDLLHAVLWGGFRDPGRSAEFADYLIQRYQLRPGSAALLTRSVLRKDGTEVRRLLAAGARPTGRTNPGSRNDTTALQQATWSGHHEMLEILLGAGGDEVDPSKLGARYLPLNRAAARGDVAEVGRRLDAGDRPDGETAATSPYGIPAETPLYLASLHGHLEAVRLLIRRGASVNALMFPHGTALSGAVRGGHGEVVAELLASGAKPDLGAPFSPLTQAVLNDRPEILRLLLKHGASVDSLSQAFTRYRGRRQVTLATPLAQATLLGHQTIIRILLDAGADPEARPPKVEILPVEWAVSESQAGALELLLRAGADTDVLSRPDKSGKSDLDRVIEKGQVEVAAVLRRHGVLEDRR